ncbi:hypothetical protein [Brevundimonas sp.]
MTDFAPDTPLPPDDRDPTVCDDLPTLLEDTWALAQELYSAGQTGQTVCRALGIPPSTFWRRAAHENWLRRDQPRGSAPAEPLDMAAAVDDLANARNKAWRRVCLAMDQGRSAEAMRWIRVHAALYAQTQTAEDTIDRSARGPTQHQPEPRVHAAMRKAQADVARMAMALGASDRLEKVESTPTDSHSARSGKGLDPDASGISRSERRRRLKYRAAHWPTPPPTGPAHAAPP